MQTAILGLLYVVGFSASAGRVWQWPGKSDATRCADTAGAAVGVEQQAVRHHRARRPARLVLATHADARSQRQRTLPTATIPRPSHRHVAVTQSAAVAHLFVIDTACVVCGARSMKQSGVRPSVCLSHHSTTAAAFGGFAAGRRAGRRY